MLKVCEWKESLYLTCMVAMIPSVHFTRCYSSLITLEPLAYLVRESHNTQPCHHLLSTKKETNIFKHTWRQVFTGSALIFTIDIIVEWTIWVTHHAHSCANYQRVKVTTVVIHHCHPISHYRWATQHPRVVVNISHGTREVNVLWRNRCHTCQGKVWCI